MKNKPVVRPEEFTPSLQILVALGSIAVHVEEWASPGGHDFDKHAALTALETTGVREWIAAMKKHGFMPVKR